jgi:hypothetical protein
MFQRYHNRLNSRISKYRPNIWAFIRCIQGEENGFNHLLIQMKGGLAARPKTKKNKLFNKELIHYLFVMIMVMLLAMNF